MAIAVDEAWADWVARGLSDDLYWKLTPVEIRAVLDKHTQIEHERAYHRALCAGMIASTIANIHRRRGTRRLKPTDFVKKPQKIKPLTGDVLKDYARGIKR